jgi:hypothetical protein
MGRKGRPILRVPTTAGMGMPTLENWEGRLLPMSWKSVVALVEGAFHAAPRLSG